MIDYSLLQALFYVVSEGGFEKASKALFITQSAVSRRIHQLESMLGEPVIVRSKPPQPTLLGKRLLNHLQQVRQLELSLNIQSLNQEEEHLPLTVRLAGNADSLATWLPKALSLPAHLSDFKFRFDLITEDQSIALKRMKAGEVMVCICDNAEPVNGGAVSALGAMRYHVVASPDFVSRYNLTDRNQLVELPCLVYDEDDKLQHQFVETLGAKEPKYVHICPSSEGFKQAMLAGLGYGLLPALQVGNMFETGELVNIAEDYFIDVPLYWHYWQTESPQLKVLRDYACEVAAEKLFPLN